MMWMLEVEGKVFDRFSGLVDPEDAEAMRRYVPVRRNRLDAFIYHTTSWAMDEGASDTFRWACRSFRAAYRLNPAAIGQPVPLVPPAVTEQVVSIVSRWRPGKHDPREMDLPDDEARLRDELYVSLGGDLGDGPMAAGCRLHSRMWSARIGDGFVHPVIGGQMWSNNRRGPAGDGDDPIVAAIYAVGDLTARWEAEPDNRPLIEREIIDLAHTLGWKR